MYRPYLVRQVAEFYFPLKSLQVWLLTIFAQIRQPAHDYSVFSLHSKAYVILLIFYFITFQGSEITLTRTDRVTILNPVIIWTTKGTVMKVTPYLKILAEKGGSDLYFSTGAPPSAKFNGVLKPLGKDSAPPGWVDSLAQEIMNDKQKAEFREKPEMNLAISTLHANNANQALDRIINFFPEERRNQLLSDLSTNLQAFVSQRLIPTVDGKRCAAIEILLNSGRVADLIKQGAVTDIKEVMEKSEAMGMRTFDSALYHLYIDGKISLDEALKNADAENNLRLRIELAAKGSDTAGASDESFGGLSLVEEPEEEDEEDAAEGLVGVKTPEGG